MMRLRNAVPNGYLYSVGKAQHAGSRIQHAAAAAALRRPQLRLRAPQELPAELWEPLRLPGGILQWQPHVLCRIQPGNYSEILRSEQS
jgi:hypothetical protein